MFDPWRLRTLRELSLRGTMSEVAEAFSLTPSAVSQQVAALEREAGVALIEPDGRGVRLTVAGRALAAHAEGILEALQEAADEMATLSSDTTGVLRLASFPTAAAALCPGVIMALREQFPRHRITLLDLEPTDARAVLLRGNVDLAIVDALALPEAGGDSQIEHEELLSDPLYCVMPRDHPASRHRTVDLWDLAEERWIMEDPLSSLYRFEVEACQAAGFVPNVIAHGRSLAVVLALVRAGCGISIQPGLAVALQRDVAFRPLRPPLLRRVYAVYRRGSGKRSSIRAALELFHQAAAAVRPGLAPGHAG